MRSLPRTSSSPLRQPRRQPRHESSRRPGRALLRGLVSTALAGTLVTGTLAATLVTSTVGLASSAAARNPVTPGSFTGYGFDQCLAPEQWEMDRWLEHSPFLAVGIYIAGRSRGCREQPNLTPTWVATQLRKGWRLLPITLGPQASCSEHFPRYGDDPTINPDPGPHGNYYKARRQGWRQGRASVEAAQRLGIVRGSTLWYDLEGFDDTQERCRESAIWFLSAWNYQLRKLGYVPGVYSSAGSGIEMLDRARAAGRRITYPEYIWIARWDGIPNTSTTYISEEGWNPHRRVKQYLGGHRETWGGVTINIDRNWLDVGKGSVPPPRYPACGGVRLSFYDYRMLRPGAAEPSRVKALQCLLRQHELYAGRVHGVYGEATVAAARAWQRRTGAPVRDTWGPRNWVTLLSAGWSPVVKRGSARFAVRRLQRALNAAGDPDLKTHGVFGPKTARALRRWQRVAGVRPSGIANSRTWAELQR